MLERYFGVPSPLFHLKSATKSLYAGPLTFTLRIMEPSFVTESMEVVEDDNGNIQSRDSIGSTFFYREKLTADAFEIASITPENYAKVKWVIIIEKETIFNDRVQELNSTLKMDSFGHGVIVTVRESVRKGIYRFIPTTSICYSTGKG